MTSQYYNMATTVYVSNALSIKIDVKSLLDAADIPPQEINFNLLRVF